MNNKLNYTESSISIYLQEIKRIPLLTTKEEIELTRRIADLAKLEKIRDELIDKLKREPTYLEWGVKAEYSGDFQRHLHKLKRAKNKLIESNLRLVVFTAKKYIKYGLSYEDLIQEGTLGLIRAAEKFDHTKGYKFSTYATVWIRQAIGRAINKKVRNVKLPINLLNKIAKKEKIIKILSQEMQRNPTEEEIAAYMNITIEKLRFINQVSQSQISLDTPIWEEDDSCLGDFIKAEGEMPEDVVDKKILRENLDNVLDILTQKERDVIRLRYGLDDGRFTSHIEIAQIYNVSRQRIRQIETNAISKLRHSKYRDTFLNII